MQYSAKGATLEILQYLTSNYNYRAIAIKIAWYWPPKKT
jgi:hypothetical protein